MSRKQWLPRLLAWLYQTFSLFLLFPWVTSSSKSSFYKDKGKSHEEMALINGKLHF